jgi:hypothetical protein
MARRREIEGWCDSSDEESDAVMTRSQDQNNLEQDKRAKRQEKRFWNTGLRIDFYMWYIYASFALS